MNSPNTLATNNTRTPDQALVRSGLLCELSPQVLIRVANVAAHSEGADEAVARLNVATGPCSVKVGKESVTEVPARHPLLVTPADQALYIEQLDSAVTEMLLRLQRVQLFVSKYFLAGAFGHRPYTSPEHPDSVSYRYTSYMDVGETPSDVAKRIADDANAFLPDELKIRHTQYFSGRDVRSVVGLLQTMGYTGDPFSQDQKRRAAAVWDRTRNLQKSLRDCTESRTLFDTPGTLEAALKEAQKVYREILKDAAAISDAGHWLSPTYGAALEPQAGFFQSPVPFLTDYARWSVHGEWSVTEELRTELATQFEFGEYGVQLVNGGMAAVEAVFTYVQDVAKLDAVRPFVDGKPIVCVDPLYFEVLSKLPLLATRLGVHLKKFGPDSWDELLTFVREECPLLVTVCSNSNSRTQALYDVPKLLAALSEESWHEGKREQFYNDDGSVKRPLFVVIDNTAAGTSAKWKQFDFGKLPSFVSVIAVESMIKYREDGLETAQAGLIETIKGGWKHTGLYWVVASGGFRIATNSLSRLIFGPTVNDIKRRMSLIADRVTSFSHELESAVYGYSFSGSVLSLGMPSHPQHSQLGKILTGPTGVVNLNLNFDRIVPEYQKYKLSDPEAYGFNEICQRVGDAFCRVAVAYARKVGIELHMGTSFGFNATRIAHYSEPIENSTDGDLVRNARFIRIALGTETTRDQRILAAVLGRAMQTLSHHLDQGTLIQFGNECYRNHHDISVVN